MVFDSVWMVFLMFEVVIWYCSIWLLLVVMGVYFVVVVLVIGVLFCSYLNLNDVGLLVYDFCL